MLSKQDPRERKGYPHDGFECLRRSQELLKEKRGRITPAISQKILGLAERAIQMLDKYPYFLARAYRVLGEVLEETSDPGFAA